MERERGKARGRKSGEKPGSTFSSLIRFSQFPGCPTFSASLMDGALFHQVNDVDMDHRIKRAQS